MQCSSQKSVGKQPAPPRSDLYRQRLGLFSYLGSLAAGEDFYKRSQPQRKNPDQTGPPNFYTIQPKNGQLSDAYFEAPKFLSNGDKYTEAAPLYKKEFENTKRMAQTQAIGWKGGAKTNPQLFSTFHYEVDPVLHCPSFKQPDGSVQTGPKNFVTTNAKLGKAGSTPNTLFGRHPEYIPDPYERKQQYLEKERVKERQKRLEVPFKAKNCGGSDFSSSKHLYGNNKPIEDRPQVQTQPGFTHHKPFLPTNPAKTQGTIGVFPEHLPDPMPEKVYRTTQEGAWRPVHKYKSVPQPSVVNHIRNLIAVNPAARNGIRY